MSVAIHRSKYCRHDLGTNLPKSHIWLIFSNYILKRNKMWNLFAFVLVELHHSSVNIYSTFCFLFENELSPLLTYTSLSATLLLPVMYFGLGDNICLLFSTSNFFEFQDILENGELRDLNTLVPHWETFPCLQIYLWLLSILLFHSLHLRNLGIPWFKKLPFLWNHGMFSLINHEMKLIHGVSLFALAIGEHRKYFIFHLRTIVLDIVL